MLFYFEKGAIKYTIASFFGIYTGNLKLLLGFPYIKIIIKKYRVWRGVGGYEEAAVNINL